jgi:hypothetical protein
VMMHLHYFKNFLKTASKTVDFISIGAIIVLLVRYLVGEIHGTFS